MEHSSGASLPFYKTPDAARGNYSSPNPPLFDQVSGGEHSSPSLFTFVGQWEITKELGVVVILNCPLKKQVSPYRLWTKFRAEYTHKGTNRLGCSPVGWWTEFSSCLQERATKPEPAAGTGKTSAPPWGEHTPKRRNPPPKKPERLKHSWK